MAPRLADPFITDLRSTFLETLRDRTGRGLPAADRVTAIARGALEGLLILDRDPATGSVLVLEAVVQAALDAGIQPGEMIGWALAGMAGARNLGERRESIRAALEARMGVGDAFARLSGLPPATA